MTTLLIPPSTRQRLAPLLSRFSGADDASWTWAGTYRVPVEALPLPWLVHLVLVQVVGSADLGINEKTWWQVPFAYDGVPAMFADGKFGMRVSIDHSAGADADKLHREIVSKLRAVIRILEHKVLKEYGDQALDDGRVTVSNQLHRLRGAYEYFRGETERLLAASDAADTLELGAPESGRMFIGISRHFERLGHAAYTGVAAVTAYFSWLEHLLVLCFAFTGESPKRGALREHLGASWQNKFRRIFDITEPAANRALGRLVQLAETYRNTYAHGGHDKHGATIGIHIEGIGLVPARLSDVQHSPQFGLFTFTPDSFTAVAAQLDEIDSFLTDGPRRMAVRWATSGLDVPFDAQSRRQLRNALRSEDRFERLIERRQTAIDRYLNFDW